MMCRLTHGTLSITPDAVRELVHSSYVIEIFVVLHWYTIVLLKLYCILLIQRINEYVYHVALYIVIVVYIKMIIQIIENILNKCLCITPRVLIWLTIILIFKTESETMIFGLYL